MPEDTTTPGRFARAAYADLDLPEVPAPASGSGIPWRSVLPVAELAMDAVTVASTVLERVRAERAGVRPDPIGVDPLRVASSFASDRVLRVDGEAPDVWSPLSGFWEARDGWVRTHGNYPHHAERLRRLLSLGPDAANDAVAAAIAGWSALDLEAAAIDAGAIVAAVRTGEQWQAHPQADAVAPLIGMRRVGDAEARQWRDVGPLPLAGVRVLDLTRVIAGPVGTRDLATAGADVLRVDDPNLVEPRWQVLDTGQGKRSTLLDLAADTDRRAFDALLAEADVLVTGYRPGALDRFGLGAEQLAETHPGLVVATVSAWGPDGPWGSRRGFDSIVQATIGIADAEAAARGQDKPGALPVQALDHSAGHLLAAGVAEAILRQRAEGGTHHVSVALARVGHELMPHRLPAVEGPEGAAPALPVVHIGALDCAPPVLGFRGAPETYTEPVHEWGQDAPTWR